MKKKDLVSVLKKAIVILVILLISLVSFLGINTRNLNGWKNILPDYELSKELTGTKSFGFAVDDSTEEQEISDGEQQEESENTEETENAEEAETSEDTDTTEEDEQEPKTTQVPVNKPENLNANNYRKARDIIEKRIKSFGIIDSTISVDEGNGNINVEVPNETNSEYLFDLITEQGKFEIVDSETEEVLLDSSAISSASAFYAQSDASTEDSILYDLGVTIEFNSAGEKKLNEISKTYVEYTDSNGDLAQKTVTIRIDGEDKRVTYFAPDSNYTNLNLTLYQGVDANQEDTFNENYRQCLIYQTLLDSEQLPITYVNTSSTYFESTLTQKHIMVMAIIGAAIVVIVAAIIIKKLGKKGVLATLIEVGFIALLLILIRYAGVAITLTSLVMILFMAMINYLLLLMIINEGTVGGLKKMIVNIIPLFITIIVFVFSKDINISSAGMVGFWGVITFIYTVVCSLLLLNERNDK